MSVCVLSTPGSVAAEQTEDEKSSSEFSLPQIPQLPTEGVDYSNFDNKGVSDLCQRLTDLVFQHASL